MVWISIPNFRSLGQWRLRISGRRFASAILKYSRFLPMAPSSCGTPRSKKPLISRLSRHWHSHRNFRNCLSKAWPGNTDPASSDRSLSERISIKLENRSCRRKDRLLIDSEVILEPLPFPGGPGFVSLLKPQFSKVRLCIFGCRSIWWNRPYHSQC